MSSALRHALISIAIVVLALLAHGGLLRAGFLGDDLDLLRAASTADPRTEEQRSSWLVGGLVRPIPGLVLRAHDSAFAGESLVSKRRAEALRMTAFVVLLLAALAAGFALRRALAPWSGGDNARAAGFACALFFATHPLAAAAVARPRALGDLCALALGALAAFLFLRGRQAREKHSIVGAGVAAILGGFASSSAVVLPFVLAGLEIGSARRPRPLADRLRTAATTFAIFAACVLVEGVAALAAGAPARAGFAHSLPDLSPWSEPLRAAMSSVEKLGLLFFPVTGGSPFENWPGYIVCVAIMLLALWPVLRSARVAPRLWGYLACLWIAAMLLALLPLAGARVTPTDGTHADLCVVATLFAVTGLATAATSLLGTRRILLPAAIAILLSALSARQARAFIDASATVAQLRTNVASAQGAVSDTGHVFVVDPPTRVRGLDLGTEPIQRILVAGASPPHVPRALPAAALPMLTRSAPFAEWRAQGIALLEHDDHAGGAIDAVRVPGSVRLIARTEGGPPPNLWRGESRSQLFDLDPGTVRFARVQALPQTSLADAPRISWRATEPAGEWVVATGVWLESEPTATAVFDLWSQPAWWSVPTVRRVRTEDPLLNVASFELLADVQLAVANCAPRTAGDDWCFDLDPGSLPRPVRGAARFVIEVLDPERLDYARFEGSESVVDGATVITAAGAAGLERLWRTRGAGSIFWSLERRVGEVAIARAGGQR